MSSRSANIALFLVLLNGSAAVVGATLGDPLGFQPTPGAGSAIEQIVSQSQELTADRSGLDNFVSGTIAAGQLFLSLIGITTAAPRMMLNIGMPPILTVTDQRPDLLDRRVRHCSGCLRAEDRLMVETSELRDLLDGEFWSVITGVFDVGAGGAIVAVLVTGGILAAQYQVQGSPILPVVTLFLVGGAMLVSIPGLIAKAVVGLVTLAVAGATYVVFQRSRRGGWR